jgi:hypothetical protein
MSDSYPCWILVHDKLKLRWKMLFALIVTSMGQHDTVLLQIPCVPLTNYELLFLCLKSNDKTIYFLKFTKNFKKTG